MKTIIILALALTVFALPQQLAAGKEKSETQALLAKVEGMTCGACVKHVSEALLTQTSLQEIYIDLPTGSVLGREVVSDQVEDQQVVDVVESLGFSVLSVKHLAKSFESAKADLKQEPTESENS